MSDRINNGITHMVLGSCQEVVQTKPSPNEFTKKCLSIAWDLATPLETRNHIAMLLI